MRRWIEYLLDNPGAFADFLEDMQEKADKLADEALQLLLDNHPQNALNKATKRKYIIEMIERFEIENRERVAQNERRNNAGSS